MVTATATDAETQQQLKDYTLVAEVPYLRNLALARMVTDVPGDVVECGVWKGGMIAGIARTLGNGRRYRLFDSFEGMPAAKEEDGGCVDHCTALEWQSRAHEHNNLAVDQSFAVEAMSIAGVDNFEVVKGFFADTVHKARFDDGIALLRLDNDWYESTYHTLDVLFPQVNVGGLIIIDDYYYWESCTRAVHDYLSVHGRNECIHEYAAPHPDLTVGDWAKGHGVAFITKYRD